MTRDEQLGYIWRSIVDAGCVTYHPGYIMNGTSVASADQQTYTNIGPAYAPEPPPKVADKPIHECNLLDYQKACKAFFARQGKS